MLLGISRIQLFNRLRPAREALGLSRRELARRSDVHANTILRIEQGVHEWPRMDVMEKLAAGLGIDVDRLFWIEPKKPEPVKKSA